METFRLLLVEHSPKRALIAACVDNRSLEMTGLHIVGGVIIYQIVWIPTIPYSEHPPQGLSQKACVTQHMSELLTTHTHTHTHTHTNTHK